LPLFNFISYFVHYKCVMNSFFIPIIKRGRDDGDLHESNIILFKSSRKKISFWTPLVLLVFSVEVALNLVTVLLGRFSSALVSVLSFAAW
jgi:hypothetical protein